MGAIELNWSTAVKTNVLRLGDGNGNDKYMKGSNFIDM